MKSCSGGGHRCDPFYVYIDRRLLVGRPRPQRGGWDSASTLVLTCQCRALPCSPHQRVLCGFVWGGEAEVERE